MALKRLGDKRFFLFGPLPNCPVLLFLIFSVCICLDDGYNITRESSVFKSQFANLQDITTHHRRYSGDDFSIFLSTEPTVSFPGQLNPWRFEVLLASLLSRGPETMAFVPAVALPLPGYRGALRLPDEEPHVES